MVQAELATRDDIDTAPKYEYNAEKKVTVKREQVFASSMVDDLCLFDEADFTKFLESIEDGTYTNTNA